MPTPETFRPTLLIGVGGTGSKIAEAVMEQALEANTELSSRIAIVALDTDENDMKKLKYVPSRSKIQISQPETVYRLLERNSAVEGDWAYSRTAPEMGPSILGMSLIEGAGQIRMLTRLALHDSIAHGDFMNKLETTISELAVHAEDQGYSGSIHVLIMGSLAGATGSGSFAQVALAVKQAARNRNVLATARGVFLLPDVYAHSGTLPTSQVQNVLANGYAALKELNAINVMSLLPSRKATFNFEYIPGAKILEGASPFEAVTFIDHQNIEGGSMGRNLDAYIEMASRAGYLMIFSPLGASYGSVTVNDVRQKLSATGQGKTNLYSGIGVSAIKYPVDAMRQFLTKRLVSENLSGDWTRLDQSFRARMARYKEELAAGQSGGEEPDIRKTYVRDLAQLAGEDPRIPFYRRAHEYMFPEVEDEKTFERVVKPRHVSFVEANTSYVENAFWKEDDMKRVRQRPGIDESSLLESDSLVDTVRRAESELDRDFRALEAALQSRPEDIFHNTLVSADGLGAGEWAAHHIQSLIVDNAPHPVTVRALLYLIREELETRRAAIDTRDQKLALFRIANAFRDDDEIQSTNNRPTTRSTNRVVDEANKAGEGSVLGKLLNRKKKAYVEEYVEYYNATVQRMRQYGNAVIQAKVYEQSLAEITALIRVTEGLFGEIEEIGQELQTDIDRARGQYSSSAPSDGNSFVYADADCLDDVWTRLSDKAQVLKLDDQVNQRLIQGIVEKYREDKRLRQKTSFKQLREMFDKEVVQGFGRMAVDDDYSSVFDISVIEAMYRQFEVEERVALEAANADGRPAPKAQSAGDRLKAVVDRASKQSLPYLSLTRPKTDGTPIKFWAVHPQCKTDVNEGNLFTEMFRSTDGENPIVAEDFSKYELTCVNLRVNVELTHLSKLALGATGENSVHAETQGRMANAYNDLVKKMIQGNRNGTEGAEFTPHIDRQWHKPGALPEIFQEAEEKILGGAAKGFVVARLLDLIELEQAHGLPIVRFSTLGRGVKDPVDEELEVSHDAWDIQQMFMDQPAFVQTALEIWDMTKARPRNNLAENPTFATLSDPARLKILMQPAGVRSGDVEQRDASVLATLGALFELLGDLVQTQERGLSTPAQRSKLQDHVDGLRVDLMSGLREEGYDTETLRVFDRLFARAYDGFFSG